VTLQTQGTTLFSAILVLVATTVILQLWLLTFSMEALLRGHYSTLIPAAIASTVLFVINAGLLRYVFRFDREARSNLKQ
jgi:hypothetical protein